MGGKDEVLFLRELEGGRCGRKMCRGSLQVALVLKNPPANARATRDVGSVPRLGRSPGAGHDSPLQYSCLKNPMNREAWWAIIHRVTKSWTRLKWLSTHTHMGEEEKSWRLWSPRTSEESGEPVEGGGEDLALSPIQLSWSLFLTMGQVLEDRVLRWSLVCSRMMVGVCPQVPSCAEGGVRWRTGRHKQLKEPAMMELQPLLTALVLNQPTKIPLLQRRWLGLYTSASICHQMAL